MTTIDKIRAEIKKLQDIFVETAKGMETEDEATVYSMCAVEFGDELLAFIDSLPDEPVSDCHDLEEAAEEYASRYDAWDDDQDIAEYAFKAGAGWMAKQQPLPEDSVAFQKGVQEGRRLEREDVKYLIQFRIDGILGDAQPAPILRMELQELIKKIEA